jgi:hypothetical protein
MTAPRRSQRRVLEGAAVAAVLSGAPSVAHALATGTIRSAFTYSIDATRAIGTLVPPGRPGLARGAAGHTVISLVVAEAFAVTLPRKRSIAWGGLAGLAVGVVNIGVIARRRFPAIAAFRLGSQIADNVAFGALFAAVADRGTSHKPGAFGSGGRG